MKQLVENAADQTTQGAKMHSEKATLLVSGDLGSGTVFVEVEVAGSFVQYPELSFTTTGAHKIEMSGSPKVRLNAVGCTSVTAVLMA